MVTFFSFFFTGLRRFCIRGKTQPIFTTHTPFHSPALQLPDKTLPAHLTPPIKSIRRTQSVGETRGEIPWNDSVWKQESVLKNCSCIMSGTTHPPSLHFLQDFLLRRGRVYPAGFRLCPDVSVPTGRKGLIWLVRKSVCKRGSDCEL